MMLQRAHWAATAFAEYDRERTHADRRGGGRGGIPKRRKVRRMGGRRRPAWASPSTSCSRTRPARAGLVERYARRRLRQRPRIDAERKIVELPRPAGVVLALTPSTNPIATVYFKVMLALMTRNAVVVSPHPLAREVPPTPPVRWPRRPSPRARPTACVQVVEEPTIPLIEALMTDPTTDVIVATGGTAVVRAAYRSGNPASASAPATCRRWSTHTADLAAAAQRLADSKASTTRSSAPTSRARSSRSASPTPSSAS